MTSEISVFSRAGATRLLLFAAAVLCLLNLVDGADLFHVARYQLGRRDIPNPLFNTSVYLAVYGLCFVSLVVGYLHKARPVRLAFYALTTVTVAADVGFRQFNDYGFTYHEAALFWSEAEFIGTAVSVALRGIALPVLACLLIFGTYERKARGYFPSISSWLVLALSLAAFPVARSLIDRTYAKVYQVPVPHRVLLLVEHTYRHQLLFYGRRDAPYLEPTEKRVADHVLLIVDESVSGDLLGINGASEDTTPYLDSISDQLFNYGVASSPSNLSSTSNIILQSGLRVDQIPDRDLRALKNPNIFSYMQKAGYKSFLLDAQIYSDKPTNLMTGFDLENLDGHLYIRVHEVNAAEYDMDLRAIDHIDEIIESSERSFTVLVKAGAHFPYDAKYPADHTFFEPTLSSPDDGDNLVKTLNSYRNALRWTVDEFLRQVIERHREADTSLVVIYTADHGQSLEAAVDKTGKARSGRPTRWPHAAPIDPPIAQASVPLLMFGTDANVSSKLAQLYQPELRDRASGFEIFPSLLTLAGYPPSRVNELYGPSLFNSAANRPKRTFVSGNLFGIGGGFYQNSLIREATYLNAFDTTPE